MLRTESLRGNGAGTVRLFALFVGLGTVLAFVEQLQAYFGRVNPESFLRGLLLMQPPWLLLGALAPCAVWLAVRFPIDRAHWPRSLPLHVLGAFVFAYGHLALLATLHRFLFGSTVPIAVQAVDFAGFYLIQNLFVYCTVVGGTHAWRFYRSLQQREIDAAYLQAMLSDARVEALRHQIHPHFFFNTLNTVVMFARSGDTNAVVTLLNDLSALLRYSFKESSSDDATISEEISFLRQYLAIEHVRFGDRLHVTWDVDPAMMDVLVPRLVLQPLVENAVRHGLSRIGASAELCVRCRRDEAGVVLEVEDNGAGVAAAAEPEGSGIGLRNVRQRLDALFSDAARLELLPRFGGGTIARIRLPMSVQTGPQLLVPCA